MVPQIERRDRKLSYCRSTNNKVSKDVFPPAIPHRLVAGRLICNYNIFMKIKFLILAALMVFLITGMVFAQSDTGGAGFDPTQFGITEDKIKDLMTVPTGKMTDEIDMEIVARISVCHKGTSISEEEFNILKSPYDVTVLEFVAYYIQRLQGGEGTSQFLEKWASRMPGLVAAVKVNGCKFGTMPEPLALEKCNGFCSISSCPSYADKIEGTCVRQKECEKCGFFGLLKCCKEKEAFCCKAKPIETCSCALKNCPAGMVPIGSKDCPAGKGKYKCGPFKLFTCKRDVAGVCCLPQLK